jgi:hypothetical protein
MAVVAVFMAVVAVFMAVVAVFMAVVAVFTAVLAVFTAVVAECDHRVATVAAAFLPTEAAARMADPAGTPPDVTAAWELAERQLRDPARILVLRPRPTRIRLRAGIRLRWPARILLPAGIRLGARVVILGMQRVAIPAIQGVPTPLLTPQERPAGPWALARAVLRLRPRVRISSRMLLSVADGRAVPAGEVLAGTAQVGMAGIMGTAVTTPITDTDAGAAASASAGDLGLASDGAPIGLTPIQPLITTPIQAGLLQRDGLPQIIRHRTPVRARTTTRLVSTQACLGASRLPKVLYTRTLSLATSLTPRL